MELAGHHVEVVLDDGKLDWADVEFGAFGQPASQQAVGLLVGGPLPGAVGVTEVDLDPEGGLDVWPAGHLAALVPGEGLDQVLGLAGQRRGDRGGGAAGVVAVGQADGEGLAAGALSEGGHR